MEAERAIATVRGKLSSDLDVECQVNELIRMATSPDNLCQIYPGKYQTCPFYNYLC
jgi:phosphatidylinositol kinase/protein kinase (PI-3  family)